MHFRACECASGGCAWGCVEPPWLLDSWGAALALPFVLVKGLGRGAYGVYSYVVLLLTQSYLLLGGLGEALAYYLANRQSEAKWWIRQALGRPFYGGGGIGLMGVAWTGNDSMAARAGCFLESTSEGVTDSGGVSAGRACGGYPAGVGAAGIGAASGAGLTSYRANDSSGGFPHGCCAHVSRGCAAPLRSELVWGVGLGVYMWAAISTLMREPLCAAFWLAGLESPLETWPVAKPLSVEWPLPDFF